MRWRSWLLKWKLWRRYRQVKRKLGKEIRARKELSGRYEAQIASTKQFYEKQIAKLLLKSQTREEALIDRILQSQKMMGIQHLAHDVNTRIELPPDIDDRTAPSEDVELTADQADYVQAYKHNFFEMGREAGKAESEIEAMWKAEYADLAVDQALTLVQN